MSFIPQSFIDGLLEHIDIVDIIDSRVKLKKSGRDYSACCPFHDEKTPSFTVSRDKQFFHCFGCGANGNAIGFLMDYERFSFPEAVESLASSAALEIPREQNPEREAYEQAREKTRQSLYQIMESANTYYRRQLTQHSQHKVAVNYLKRRGLNGETARRFSIGFAPPGYDNLTNEMMVDDESRSLLLEAGLLIENEQQGVYDRFRHRIMFPIRDTRGRIIAFGGRILGDGQPKYLNSPETSLFHKNKTLYGLHEARQAHRQLTRLLVVEGYMDVVSLAQFGIHYAVATLGTACGPQHLELAFRFADEIVFCFDGDRAGRKAALRALENALPTMEDGRQIKFLYLPDGEDPDTLIRQIGVDKFTRLIDESAPLENVLFDELSQNLDTQTMEGRARLCKLAAPLLDQLPRGVYRELCFSHLARRTQLSMDTLAELLNDTPKNEQVEITAGESTNQSENYTVEPIQLPLKSPPPVAHNKRLNPADLALALLLYQPALAQKQIDINELQYSEHERVKMLLELIALLKQRPEFSSGQILGHWQGAYGTEATASLKALMKRVTLFHRARELSTKDSSHPFDPSTEFIDALNSLKKDLKQKHCDSIVQKLNQKPLSEWSSSDKQLYREATNSLKH